jgi:hypothetical protein
VSSSLLITLEMAGVLGAVLVFGFYELWSLRRDKARERERNKAEDVSAQKKDESTKHESAA